MSTSSQPIVDIANLLQRVAAADPWSGDLPPGPELRKARRICEIAAEFAAPAGGVSVRSLARYEREEVERSSALESPRFRQLVTVLYEVMSEQKARTAVQDEMRQSLAGVEA